MSIILHICTAEAWSEAQARGDYRAASLTTEGFVHCSEPAQVVKTANLFYHGQSDLVLLVIETERVTAELKYEAADSDLFPHIYGPLNLDAVAEVKQFAPTEDGTFKQPNLD